MRKGKKMLTDMDLQAHIENLEAQLAKAKDKRAPKDSGLRAAIKAAGTRYRLAKLLGVSPSSVLRWTRIPADRVVEVERVTDIPREQLRPDLYRYP
jgi:Bacterial toxin YdaS